MTEPKHVDVQSDGTIAAFVTSDEKTFKGKGRAHIAFGWLKIATGEYVPPELLQILSKSVLTKAAQIYKKQAKSPLSSIEDHGRIYPPK